VVAFGRVNESLAEMDRALRLDPLSALASPAEKSCRRALELDSHYPVTHVVLV
jgi:hypothetical protein